jgi:hypothetical protein
MLVFNIICHYTIFNCILQNEAKGCSKWSQCNRVYYRQQAWGPGQWVSKLAATQAAIVEIPGRGEISGYVRNV